MDKKTIYAMKNAFDEIVKIIQEEAVEFWYARDLMALLGYDRWENFHKAIERAIDSCKASEIEPADHFRSVTKMVQIGSGAERAVKDYMLTRYACYLIAQNGDPRKETVLLHIYESIYCHAGGREHEAILSVEDWKTA